MNPRIHHQPTRTPRPCSRPTPAPISRAIRMALAVSATVLTLGLPVAGLAAPAGDHALPGATPVHVRDDARNAADTGLMSPVDLTVVTGDSMPSSVHATFGPGEHGPAAASAAPRLAGADRRSAGHDADADDVAAIHDLTVVGGGDVFAVNADGANAASGTDIDVYGTYYAVGIHARKRFSSAIDVDGDLDVRATAAAATAYGVVNLAGLQSYLHIEAAGQVSVNADALAGDAVAVGAYVATLGPGGLGASAAKLRNDGDLSATATATGGSATATGAHLYSAAAGATLYNAGDIAASATSDGGLANATGVLSAGFASADASNQGTITASASGAQATAAGLIDLSYLQATTTNTGSIRVDAEGGLAPYGQYEAVAVGVYTAATLYDAAIDNRGTIAVNASATTDISGSSGFLVAKAMGARAVNRSGHGQALISNAGDISAAATTSQGYATAWGAIVQSGANGQGDAQIDNDGSIMATAISQVGNSVTTGAYVNSGDSAVIVNHGDIGANSQGGRGYANVSSATAYATGAKLYGFAYGADGASASNDGTITAQAAIVGGYMAEATALQINGSTATVDNAAGGVIAAAAETQLFGIAHATAVQAGGKYGVNVVNDGSITAYSHAHAYDNGVYGYTGASGATGIDAKANYKGNVAVVNHGDITAQAVTEHGVTFFDAGAGATGVHAYAKYDAVVENTGTISGIATSDLGIVAAYGVSARGKYSTHIINDAGARIVASASSGSLLTDAYGGRAIAMGAKAYGSTQAIISNDGSILAQALVSADGGANANSSLAKAWGATIGAYSTVASGTVVNHGDIQASATAPYGEADAFGSYVRDNTTNPTATVVASTVNTGTIAAVASADHGEAFAVGSYLLGLRQLYYVDCSSGTCQYPGTFTANGGTAALDNAGAISAAATAHGGSGEAYGVTVLGAFGSGISNSGDIGAAVDADIAHAVGALDNSRYGVATLTNSGRISAIATGDSASATGVFIAGAYGSADTGGMAVSVDNGGQVWAKATGTTTAAATGIQATGWKDDGIRIDNRGTIGAAAYGVGATATAVSMTSRGDNLLTNTGTIGAYGDGARIAIASAEGGTATIGNAGAIVGAIVTASGNDSFSNAAGGIWKVVGAQSDFGGGDDAIANLGTIALHDASMSLGGFGSQGNAFANGGTLVVSGDSAIDMGAGNPNPFGNSGSIDLRNGVAGDRLTVFGDWAGSGRLGMDVDVRHAAGDALHVTGGVAPGSVTTVDVDLLGTPTTALSAVPIITVDGAAGAGSFVLGDVHFDASKSFLLAQAVSLDPVIDAGNAHPDVFSLGVAVTGLSDTGSLAAAFVPGVQRLMGSEIGTWRQRMGVLDPQPRGRVGAWARVFSDSGTVTPSHVANNFGQGGNVAFDQDDSGQELGVDVALADGFSAGLMLGKAQASQHLDGAGAIGTNKITGDTRGAYATWVSGNGFYLDASYRQMRFDARLDSLAGQTRTSGRADAFNAELGWSWTLGDGLDLVPQLQYTHTTVDHVDTLGGALAGFTPDGGTSSRGRAGLLLSKDIAAGGTRWTPYAAVSAVREFDGRSGFTIDNAFSGSTDTRGTSALVEGGLAMRRGKLSLFGGVNWQDGGALGSVVGGQLGLRYSW